MKKSFKMTDVDCANCAAKMEHAISKLPGVNSVTVNFFAQKLILDAEDDRFDQILEQAVRECKKVDSNCDVIR